MAGGAAAQESLRDVPPPRLPFWVNARSRMLEAAKNPPARKARPVLTGSPALSMSLAGIVAAVAIAGAAFFTTQGGQPSAAAELAAIERQVSSIEQQQRDGVFVSPDLLADITKRTNDLAARLKDDSSQTFVTLSLQPLIDRQWAVIQNANTIKPPVGEVPEAREQITAAQNQLLAAEEKVQVITSKAAISPPQSRSLTTARSLPSSLRPTSSHSRRATSSRQRRARRRVSPPCPPSSPRRLRLAPYRPVRSASAA